MRRRLMGLAVAAFTIVTGSVGRADEVGCCASECRTAGASGGSLVTMTKIEMTQADCESRFSSRHVAWRQEAYGEAPNEQATRAQLEDAVRANERAADLARRLYAEGLTDFLTVLAAEQSLLTSKDTLAQT